MSSTAKPASKSELALPDQICSAILWRSGAQIAGQFITWASTILVIRLLSPSDYGLYVMTSAVFVLISLVNGYSLAIALIRRPEVKATPQR